jgi:polyphosphate glucokinase
MQGLSLISGQGLEFVVTLGTGVGTAWYRDGELLPHMELGQHPIYDNQTYDQYLGDATRKAIGHKAWQERVERMLKLVELLLRPDRIFLGGGNAVHIPPSADRHIKIGSNDAAFQGGAALWRHVAQSGNNTGSYS